MAIPASAMSEPSGGARTALQRFGGFLAGMVMPNIGAFIAWGLITAFFIPSGWLPNPKLAQLVNPFVNFLIPLLIGYTGGKLVHGERGGVVGAIATAGVAVGSSVPMFIGAMILGPLAGYLMKTFDRAVKDRIPAGFEMLVNTFSAGILGGILAILAFLVVEPAMTAVSAALGAAAQWITSIHLLPLIAIFIEPGKILFLNNAINHGVLDPLGLQQAKETGKSIFFLLETDPGPGLGVLLAYWLFGRGNARLSAPGAILIQFFGGIHEIYFPYVLMKPILVLAVIAGGIAGDATFMWTGAGLVATASPGSIIAEIMMSPRGGLLPVLFGIFVAAAVSFMISSLLLRTGQGAEGNLDEAKERVRGMKLQSKGLTASAQAESVTEAADHAIASAERAIGQQPTDTLTELPNHVVFACEAGMGSSAMGASILKKRLQAGGFKMEVTHVPVNQIPPDATVVFTQQSLAGRARQVAPHAKIYVVDNFLDKATYDAFVEDLKRISE
ncbi:PTS mannitol transporter subunit IICB [Alicyclobacillus shizuokensis]|uniref:PTS mannitol transporter subunit IICB n=1 Tax=Alicyclobacillus shizuokensis TaxID=392014 RepID=UPI000836CEB3|nr:PTS mannitol transporter subunit IICB [Alicyclobacillus shizuokensis]MCL6625478.1 PTS mannitol transporter subunit IICB [Alicyclobacillus shizuokensis]